MSQSEAIHSQQQYQYQYQQQHQPSPNHAQPIPHHIQTDNPFLASPTLQLTTKQWDSLEGLTKCQMLGKSLDFAAAGGVLGFTATAAGYIGVVTATGGGSTAAFAASFTAFAGGGWLIALIGATVFASIFLLIAVAHYRNYQSPIELAKSNQQFYLSMNKEFGDRELKDVLKNKENGWGSYFPSKYFLIAVFAIPAVVIMAFVAFFALAFICICICLCGRGDSGSGDCGGDCSGCGNCSGDCCGGGGHYGGGGSHAFLISADHYYYRSMPKAKQTMSTPKKTNKAGPTCSAIIHGEFTNHQPY